MAFEGAVQLWHELPLPPQAAVCVPGWQVLLWQQPVLQLCIVHEHTPLTQTTPVPHDVPSDLIGFEHTPVDGAQVPTSWHESSAVQVTVEVGEPQTPFWHDSPAVHRLLSSQAEPLVLFGFEHTPVDGLHVPAT
jgi:hypothetical protein